MSNAARLRGEIRLLVFDFDHTALGGHVPYDRFPKPFVLFLDRLSARGIRWATNTTWAPESQLSVIRQSGVKSDPAFLGGMTGRGLATVRRGKLIWDKAHQRDMARLDRRFDAENSARIRRAMSALLKANLVRQLSWNDYQQNQLAFTVRPGCVQRAWRVLAPLLRADRFYVWDPRKRSANMLLPFFMNKAQIIRTMQRRLGIGPANTIVAGDGINDRHMFDPSIARKMVCPANAQPQIKRLVRRHGGIVANRTFSWGVIEGVREVISERGRTTQ
jgi:hypothetical protein